MLLIKNIFSLAGFGYLLAIFFWVIFARYPALMDYTEWSYHGFLIRKYLSGNEEVLRQFYLASHPVPNSLSQAALAAFNFILDPIPSGRLWLLFYLSGWLCLALLLWKHTSSLERNSKNKAAFRNALMQKSLITILFFSLAAGGTFWNGFINFQFSLLIVSAYLYVRYIKGKNAPYLSFFFSILLFFTHFSSFCIFIFILFYDCLLPRDKRSFSLSSLWANMKSNSKHFLALGPSLVCSLLYFMNLKEQLPINSATLDSPINYLMYKFYTLMKTGPFHNFILDQGESFLEAWPFLYWSGFSINLCFAMLLGTGALFLFLQVYFLKENSLKSLRLDPLMIALSLCLGLYLFLPPEFVVVNLGERFLLIGLAILLVMLIRQNPQNSQREELNKIGENSAYTQKNPTPISSAKALDSSLFSFLKARFLYPAMGSLCILLLPYYFYFLSWNALGVKKIDFSSDTSLVQASRKEKDASQRARMLYPNSSYLYFNHRLYNYKELFPILKNKTIHAEMPYHYKSSFLQKRKIQE